MRTRSLALALLAWLSAGIAVPEHPFVAYVCRDASENSAEAGKRLPDDQTSICHLQFPDRIFMHAAALLHDGQSFPDSSFGFEVAEEHDVVREIAQVDGRGHTGAHQACLREHHDRHDAELAQVAKHLVHLDGEVLL